MENQDRPKIYLNEITSNSIHLTTEQIAENEQFIVDALEDVKEGMEILKEDIVYLEHMNENNQFIEDYKEAMGKDSGLREYSSEGVEKIKQNIAKMQSDIARINNFINELILNSVALGAYKDEFEKLDEEFKNKLIQIDSFKLN